MNKIREIIKKVGIEGDLSEIPSQYLHERIINAVMEFGEVCFEASREHTWHIIDEYSGFEKNKHSTYEDFLKEIENET